MLRGVGLEVMNPINAEFKWQTVTKGKRSKTSMNRSLNGVAKFDKTGPKRVRDIYGSDCNKLNKAALGRPASDKTEHAPIKKRRRLLRSSSPQRHFSSPLSEGFEDELTCDHDSAWDFSGIELLAATAIMDDDSNNESKESFFPEDSSTPKKCDSSILDQESKIGSKCNYPLNNSTGHVHDTDCSLGFQDVKVDRKHWNLNTVMDSWHEQIEGSIDGHSSKNDLKFEIEENKLKAVSPDGACNVSPSIQENLRELSNDYVSNAAKEAFDQNADEKIPGRLSETPSQVLNTEARDFRKTLEPCGAFSLVVGPTYVQDDQSVVIDNSKVLENLKPAEPAVKNDDDDLQNQESRMIKRNDSPVSVGQISSTIDTRHDSKISQRKNGYDSPYEDGELRGSLLASLEENGMEAECVDYESDDADFPGFEEIDEVGSNEDVTNVEICGKKGSNAGSGTTVEQYMEILNESNEDGTKTHLFDRIDGKVARIDKDVSEGKLQSFIGQSTDGKGVFFRQQNRPHRLGGYFSRPEKYPFRYRKAAQVTERGRVDRCTYGSSRNRYDANFEGQTWTKPRHINPNYESKDFGRPFIRKPHFDRNESINVHRRMPLPRENSSLGRVNYSRSANTKFEKDFEPLLSKRRSRSRSRTRSPMMWQPHRERLGTRRHNKSPDSKFEAKTERIRVPFSKSPDFRSEAKMQRRIGVAFSKSPETPDFRSEAKMDRLKAPFSKPKFASDYGRVYSSPPSDGRWADGRTFGYNRLKHTERFDHDSFSGRSKSDEYLRPNICPGRFSTRGGDGKFETSYKYTRMREDRGEVMHRGRGYDRNLRGREDRRVQI